MKKGFTLVELLACIAIAAILAAVAIPTWRGVVMRAHRGDAIQALYAVAAAQERYRMVHGRYADQAGPAPPVGLGLAASERGWYRLRIERADATGFVASARPLRGTPPANDAACRLFTMDELGARGSSPAPPDTCWP
jgi:type IV pilus assembly protein PilE